VWRSFLRAHAHLTRVLERELYSDRRLSLAAFDVLTRLAEAPQQRLRMTDLAAGAVVSRSGITRLIDRLEDAGLVRRGRVVDDARGVAAYITGLGLDRLRAAAPTHLAGIRTHFADRLDEADLAALERATAKLIGD
jgi:DNA-binding MarR family transcriptional regulator